MLLWVLAVGSLAQPKMAKKIKCADGVYDYAASTKYCILLFIVPLFFVALRSEFIDTGSYIREFNRVPLSLSQFSDYLTTRDSCQLFYGFQMLFKCLLTDNSQIWIAFLAVIQAFLVMHTLKKYSCDLQLSVFLFIASSMIGSWMCNGIRQFTAVAIIFFFTDWVLQKKWYLYLPLLIFMMGLDPICNYFGWDVPFWLFGGIHQSVLIMILAFFCIQGKAFNWRVWAAGGALLIFLLSGALDAVMETAVENTDYTVDVQYALSDTGTNILRVGVCSVPALMALVKYNYFKKKDIPPIIHLSVNASVITMVIYIASAFTSGIYVGRLPIYTEMYNLILLPWLVKHPYKEYSQLLRIGLICAYILYFFYQFCICWKGYYISDLLGINC